MKIIEFFNANKALKTKNNSYTEVMTQNLGSFSKMMTCTKTFFFLLLFVIHPCKSKNNLVQKLY